MRTCIPLRTCALYTVFFNDECFFLVRVANHTVYALYAGVPVCRQLARATRTLMSDQNFLFLAGRNLSVDSRADDAPVYGLQQTSH
jgi:hypothetical protein